MSLPRSIAATVLIAAAPANAAPIYLSCAVEKEVPTPFSLNEDVGTVSYALITPDGLHVHAQTPAVFTVHEVIWQEATNASLRAIYIINRKTLAISRTYQVGERVEEHGTCSIATPTGRRF